jgi:hypothetical protein
MWERGTLGEAAGLGDEDAGRVKEGGLYEFGMEIFDRLGRIIG